MPINSNTRQNSTFGSKRPMTRNTGNSPSKRKLPASGKRRKASARPLPGTR